MELDLETFLTILYVLSDDLYEQRIRPQLPPHGGRRPELSDAEVLCLGLAAALLRGVPWCGERAFVRYAHRHLRPLFPKLTSQSAFNRRVRRLGGVFCLMQQAIVAELEPTPVCELLDCVPLRQARGARSWAPKRMAEYARRGKGGTDGFFYGYHGLLAVTPSGLVTGWLLAAGNVQDRWLAELLLSARAGQPQLTGPGLPTGVRQPQPPQEWLSPPASAGPASAGPLVADRGFAGDYWQPHWAADYGATVLTPAWPKGDRPAAGSTASARGWKPPLPT